MDPLYVIPDIHGHKDKLDQALALIHAWSGAAARVVFLGDYVDRGPDSRGVVQTLIDGIEAGQNWTALRGNHDQLFLDAMQGTMEDAAQFDWWRSHNMGGSATLASYGIETAEFGTGWANDVPQAHREFLTQLPHVYETSDLFLCHAGIQPGVSFDAQDPHDLIWIREPFLSDPRDHGKLVVHGHTPVDHPEHRGNRVALDGGAAWGRHLYVAVFEGRDAWLLTGAGRTPLRP
ncbi:MAG: metallophosphoesterase family protein [Pseudomonadota bacterium]